MVWFAGGFFLFDYWFFSRALIQKLFQGNLYYQEAVVFMVGGL